MEESSARPETKVCAQCGIEKPITLFRKFANKYVASHYTDTCKECYWKIEEARRRQWQAEQEAKERAEAEAREQAERERQARNRELSLQANVRCPRCKQIRADGHLWPDGRLYFPRYCENCTNGTPHSLYVLYCPLLGVVRYVGITCQSLKKRLAGHMRGDSGTEHKRAWIESLRAQGLTACIELIDEAPNEKQAQEKEQQWIDHYLARGCPLTNSESLHTQRVLDVQSGRIASTDEDVYGSEEYEYWRCVKTSAQSFRGACQSSRQLEINRWRNRFQHAYFLDTTYNAMFPLQCRAEKAKEYDRVTFEHTLPPDRAERQAALSHITIAYVYWKEDHPPTTQQREDIRYLWNKHIPVIVHKVDERWNSVEGLVTGFTKQHIPLVHPFSYSIDSNRALTLSIAPV